ncbi:uncharacterized protein LOC135463564 [Liolophura sinensis]|uniref:uncharacterized protein LOC135463564 n=1 Tax=Liolophura sinensis TaxID=3198878 RepID=UPI003158DB0E
MKITLYLLGLIVASVLLTEAQGKKHKCVIPKKICRRGLFDEKACKCKCNAIGDVSPAVFCWLNTLMCKTKGTPVADGCCTDFIDETNVVSDTTSSSSSAESE